MNPVSFGSRAIQPPVSKTRPVFGQQAMSANPAAAPDAFRRSAPKQPVLFSGAFPTGFKFSPDSWTAVRADALIVPVYEDENRLGLSGQMNALDSSMGSALSDLVSDEDFKGEAGDVKVVRARSGDGLGVRKIVLVGLGKPDKASLASIETAMGKALNHELVNKLKNVVVALPNTMDKISKDAAVRAVVSGVDEVTYRTLDAIDDPEKLHDVESVTFVNGVNGTYTAQAFDQALKSARAFTGAVNLAKDLSNAPYNELSAEGFAAQAERVEAELKARGVNNVTVSVERDPNKVRQIAPAAYAVGKGAIHVDPPRLIKMTYKPDGPVKEKIALLGKSIMYDTGGVQDKAVHMNGMNKDMTGGAYAMGIIKALGELQPKGVEVSVYLPAVVNRDGPNAYLPSDRYDTASGKRIHIGHTDAEGRVTLIDAAALAARDGYKKIISIATLTGDAVRRSPGKIALVNTESNNALRDEVLEAAGYTGEAFNRFPLVDEDFEAIQSPHDNAHIVNMARSGYPRGLEAAAAFIQEGLPEGDESIDYVHLDIAPVMSEGLAGGFNAAENDATGKGVKTLLQYILNQAK